MVEAESAVETYRSPTERLKGEIVNLLFQCITHNSKGRMDSVEKFAFCTKVRDLSTLLEKYTPRSKRQELLDWYKQQDKEISDILNNTDYTVTMDKKEDKILGLMYKYATEVHRHNERILINSPIVETDVEGELDIDDTEILDIIRLKEKRKDDGRIEFKH
jgi:hypothetical protein